MRFNPLLVWAVVLLSMLAGAPAASAQIFTPAYLGPHQHGGIGAFVSGGTGGGDGFALEGVARRGFGSFDLGVRAGVADVDGTAALVGLEYRNPIEIPSLPFDLAATGAAQGIISDDGGSAVGAGITGGRTFPLQNVAITPYVHPRVALVDLAADDDSVDLAFLLELGAEFAFVSDFNFHVALGVGDETADLGFGVSWP